MTPAFYAFMAGYMIIIGCLKLFIYNEKNGKLITGLMLIILGLMTQIEGVVGETFANSFGYAGYLLITIGLWILILTLIQTMTGRGEK